MTEQFRNALMEKERKQASSCHIDVSLPDDLADDRLVGVAAIAQFRNESRRRTQYLIDIGELPHGREGRVIVASKRALRAHWARLTSA
jgi:hypothetical protein